MSNPNILYILIYTAILIIGFYAFFCLISKKILYPNWKKLIYIVFLFSLLGVIGEDFVNTFYELILGTPMWEYRLYPLHNGNISYFFPLLWGTLGFYTYWRNVVFHKDSSLNKFSAGLILGLEAIFIELLVNISYYFIFGDYIFYYFPENLWIFSHFSCLQVVPFYMLVGYVTSNMIQQQEKMDFIHFRTTIIFYSMIMLTFVYL